MKTKIYEYSDGYGNTRFWDTLVLDESGSGCWELEVEIPDYLHPYIAQSGRTAFEPDNSFPQGLGESLASNNGRPCIKWITGNGKQKYHTLSVLSRTEKSTAMYL